MSHLFVLERITAHIYMRGQIKFATRLPVLCSVLLFLIRIIKQRFEGHNSFSLLVCVLSEAKEMEKTMKYWIRPASLTTTAKPGEISELYEKFNSIPFDDRINRMSSIDKIRRGYVEDFLRDRVMFR